MKTKKKYNRILQISDDAQQITLPDARYYKRNGEYYPSITYVLSCYPKGKHFQEWLKKVGYSADYIVKKAGEDGTQVHEMIEDYLNGKELNFLEHGIPMYDPNIWQGFLRFVEWWETYKPTLLETEVHLFSDKIKVAGTCDLVCEIDGEVWVIDFKFSNNLQTTYELQTAIYSECYSECFGKMPDRQGILWLKSSKRGPKEGKIQGKGWELFESKRTHEENLDIFKTVKKLFDLENPKHKPTFTEFKTKVKREV
jgi:ATP-dependent exoDNAse (exonuclease V) beta subunit